MIPLIRPSIYPEQDLFLKQLVHHPEYHTEAHFATACEHWFMRERFIGSQVWAVSSCTHALETAFLALNLPQGAEVILASWNFVSAANAVVKAGCIPVWADVDAETGNLDVQDLEALITPNTKALLVMHYLGTPAPMNEIMALAHKHGLFVVEDAAYGLFSEYGGKPLGSIGHMGCISFDHTKPLHSGKGGLLIVNDAALQPAVEVILDMGTDKAAFLRGEKSSYRWMGTGSKFRMPEASAALLLAGLEHYPEIRSSLQAVRQVYTEKLPYRVTGQAGVYMELENEPARDRFIAALRQHDIYVAFHYQPLHQSPFGSQFTAPGTPFPHTERLAAGLVRLPFFPDLKPEELDEIVTRIGEFAQHMAPRPH